MNYKLRAKPIYNGAMLSEWQIVSNPHRFKLEQFQLLLSIWAQVRNQHGIYRGAIKKTEHRDGTVTIAAPAEAWEKAAQVVSAERESVMP